MQFGWSLICRGSLATEENLVRLAEKADRLGYDSIWVTDHIVIPTRIRSSYPYSADGRVDPKAWEHYLEPLTLLSYLLAKTRRVKVGTSVLIIPYRNPVLTAKILSTADFLSGGRVILGAGVGWMEEEFLALGLGYFRERGAVTDEFLQVFRTLWREEESRFEGRYVRFQEVLFAPKPVQRPSIPIWIGGHTKAAMRRAAHLGDGWMPIGLRPPVSLRPPELAEAIRQVKAMTEDAGRDPQALTIAFRAPLWLGTPQVGGPGALPDEKRRPLTGSPADIIEDIGRYKEAGVSHMIFDYLGDRIEEFEEVLERFASEVRPKIPR